MAREGRIKSEKCENILYTEQNSYIDVNQQSMARNANLLNKRCNTKELEPTSSWKSSKFDFSRYIDGVDEGQSTEIRLNLSRPWSNSRDFKPREP